MLKQSLLFWLNLTCLFHFGGKPSIQPFILSIGCLLQHLQIFHPFKSCITKYQITNLLKFLFFVFCFPLLKPYNQHKFDFHTQNNVFIGYSPLHKSYKCLDKSGKVFIARHVTFNESKVPYTELFLDQSPFVMSNSADQTHSQVTFLQSCTPVDSNREGSSIATPVSTLSSTSSSHSVSSSLSQSFPSPSIPPSHPMITKAKTSIFKPKTYLAVSQDLELANVKAALQDSK